MHGPQLQQVMYVSSFVVQWPVGGSRVKCCFSFVAPSGNVYVRGGVVGDRRMLANANSSMRVCLAQAICGRFVCNWEASIFKLGVSRWRGGQIYQLWMKIFHWLCASSLAGISLRRVASARVRRAPPLQQCRTRAWKWKIAPPMNKTSLNVLGLF